MVVQTGERLDRARLTWGGQFFAEFLKLWSMPQTTVLYAVTAIVVVGFGYAAVLVAGMDADGGMPPIDAFLDPTHLTLSGVGLAQMAVACVGVMALSTEYGSGLIRSTLVAAPRRGRLFLAKAAALGLSTFAVMVPTAFTAFLVAREPLESLLGTAWPMDAVVVRALLGTGIYLTGIALLGLAAAALVRYTAGGIGVVFVLLFVLPMLPLVLPVSARETVEAFLPADAGSRLMKVTTPDAVLNAGTGALVFGIYIIMALVAAWAVLSRRDIR
ncbi:hypothetical protein NE857_28010 [Nocardiopsis exhalans]|uniref:ABC transporter permease n=1 Tax=Nocardiopsis exhalans TaxID=163604 RepID=A0ABY5D7D7_9ACTN|nr:hypothetical protein [Nocardiopsis exhalans]USY19077.1 hypothetical protein NE857_28010 [Nocardiopsis exhalans]